MEYTSLEYDNVGFFPNYPSFYPNNIQEGTRYTINVFTDYNHCGIDL